MITEKDVEKLDSIKPYDIQKLGAMQDPKTASAGTVLTAVAGGKSEYKEIPSAGAVIKKHPATTFGDEIKTDETGNYISLRAISSDSILRPFVDSVKAGGTTKMDLSTISLIPLNGYIRVYFSPAAMTQYSLTTGSRVVASVGYIYYE